MARDKKVTNMNPTSIEAPENPISEPAKVETGEFTLFSPDGRGKKSENAPCKVTFEKISLNDLTEEQKQALVDRLVKDSARNKYFQLSKGYRMVEKFLADARALMIGFGIENPSEEQVRNSAILLAKRDDVQLAFEPVTSFYLNRSEVIDEKSDENKALEGESAAQ